jgi:hypothetical protein
MAMQVRVIRLSATIGGAALVLGACSSSELPSFGLEAGEYTRQPAEFSISTTAGAPLGAPDLAVARAAEAAALQEITTHLHPEDRAQIIAALAGKNPEPTAPVKEGSGHYLYGVRDNSASLPMYARYFAARAHRQAEERRAASIARARARGGIDVVVALGGPPSGDEAVVLRRQATTPFAVIVLGPGSTGEALGGALAALEQNRADYGDDLDDHLTIGLRDAHATNVDAIFSRQLQDIIARLRNAPIRVIEGVGNVRALDLPAIELGGISATARPR